MSHLDLRPLSVGEVLDRTFSLYRRHFLLFIGIAAIPHLLTLALGLLQVFYLQQPVVIGQGDKARTVMLPAHGAAASAIAGIVTLLIVLVVYLLSQGGAVIAVSELYLGRATSIWASLRRAWGDIVSLFGVVTLNGFVTFAGLLLLVIPGFYFACRLLVCVPAALIEGRGPRESLSRSWNLTRDYAGRALVVYGLYFVLAFGMAALIGGPIGFAVNSARNDPSMLRVWMSVQQVASVLMTTLVSPLLLIGTSIFYFDLRVRKEAFDLQFMMDPTSERMAPGGGPMLSILS